MRWIYYAPCIHIAPLDKCGHSFSLQTSPSYQEILAAGLRSKEKEIHGLDTMQMLIESIWERTNYIGWGAHPILVVQFADFIIILSCRLWQESYRGGRGSYDLIKKHNKMTIEWVMLNALVKLLKMLALTLLAHKMQITANFCLKHQQRKIPKMG